MFLARVIGSVVATNKDPAISGQKLLLLRTLVLDDAQPDRLRPGSTTLVAFDTLGAGAGDLVLTCAGSSARQAAGMKALPVDAVVIGIVDTVDALGRRVYPPPPA